MKLENKTQARILLVDDDAVFRMATEAALKNNNYDVICAGGVSEACEYLKRDDIDLVVTDFKMNDGTGLDIVAEARQRHREIAVIILTAYGSISDAVEAMRRGASYYIAKPVKTDELLLQIEKGLETKNLREELNNLREEIAWKYGFDSMVGTSAPMRQLKSLAARVAATDISIIVSGESGTGKELLAKAIHYHSRRRKNKFVPIDCASIPENLLESEFFGHKKGSFTNAYSDHIGLFEQANGGTVFLDEVGDMPLMLQAKILRVLQESEIRPIGSTECRKIDVRIIAATNANLSEMVHQGRFREDLYYRLNAMPLQIAPLRDRTEDISLLVEHFIKEENARQDETRISISTEAMEKLIGHKWPGNVRELKNTIRRAVALCQQGRITASDIMFITTEPMPHNIVKRIEISDAGDWTLEESLRQRIEATLHATNWNYTRTAAKLGIGRTTLWRKIRKYNIARGEEIAEVEHKSNGITTEHIS